MKGKNYAMRPLAWLLFAMIFVAGCRKDEDTFIPDVQQEEELADGAARCYQPQSFKSEIAQQWYSLFLRLIPVTPGHTPPVVARELAYSGVVLYETVTGGLQGHQSMGGQLSGLGSLPARQQGQGYIAVVSANAGMAKIIKYMMGNASAASIASIDSLENANAAYHASLYSPADINRSIQFGRDVADAVYNWSLTDGGHQGYLDLFPPGYVPPVGTSMWVPTPPLFQPAMLPYWGNVRTFAAANSMASINPPPHPAFSTTPGSAFYNSAYSVYTTGLNLTQAQKDIANHWADGGGTFTPPGHNLAIALQAIRMRNINLRDASVILAKAAVAMHDGAIVCWRAKFAHNLLRPVSYIKTYIDANWMPYIGTPPFPSYTSGHSTISGAASRILSMRFGNHFAFNDSTKLGTGNYAVRSFTSFKQAAQEAAISRLYGGIHYDFDNNEGYNCGIQIANNVAALNW